MLLFWKICKINIQESEYSTDTNNLERVANQSEWINEKIKFKTIKKD